MKDYPHDEFFKYLFSILAAARAFFEAFLPANLLETLDLETLQPDDTEYITPDLASVFSDKVYRCMLKKTEGLPLMAAIALLEHKSFLPDYPHFQLNEYRQRIWNLLVQEGKKPVAVIPIILYHGADKWTKKALLEYFGDIPEALKPYIGAFEYVLVDLSKYSDEEILRLRLGFLAFGLLTMKHSSDKVWLVEQIRVIFEKGDEFLATEDGRAFVNHLFVYYSRISQLSAQELKSKIIKNFSEKMQTETLSTYDQLILQGKQEGLLEQRRLTAETLIQLSPRWTNEKIAKASMLSPEEVKAIRLRLAKAKRAERVKKARSQSAKMAPPNNPPPAGMN